MYDHSVAGFECFEGAFEPDTSLENSALFVDRGVCDLHVTLIVDRDVFHISDDRLSRELQNASGRR